MKQVELIGPIRDKVLASLVKVPLMKGLAPQQLDWVCSQGKLIQFDDGETLMKQGQPADCFFLIMRGGVLVLVRPDDGGPKYQVGRLKAPESVGEISLLLGEARSATVVADDEALVLQLSPDTFQALFRESGSFGTTMCRALGRRLKDFNNRLPVLYRDPGTDPPPAEIVAKLPLDFRNKHKAIPLVGDDNSFTVGFVEQPDPEALRGASKHLGGAQIKAVQIDQDFFDESNKVDTPSSTWLPVGSPLPPGMTDSEPPQQSSPKLDAILKRMIQADASDLHLAAGQVPYVRVDGELLPMREMRKLGPNEAREVLSPVMPVRNQWQFQEDNDTDFAYAPPGLGRFRVSMLRDMHGVGAVFRRIPDRILSLKQLGMPPVLQSFCHHRKGLVLVTGPTGSGKTTTLAAMLDYINRNLNTHIITLEDPIEFVHPSRRSMVNQREIGPHTKSFSRALRASLRQDPDIVLVGELRDLETIQLALETAVTGHLVLGTLHTSTAPQTVDRIINSFPAEQQNQIRSTLSETLKGVVCQMLCKKIGGGRIAAAEVLVANAAVANLVRDAKVHLIPNAMVTARKMGNQLLNDHLARLVVTKQIDFNEAMSRSLDRADLGKRMDLGPGTPPPPPPGEGQ